MGQQTTHDLGNQVAIGLVADQGVQQDAVRPPIRMEQHVALVAVVAHEVGGAGRFGHPVEQVPADGVTLSRGVGIVAQHGQQPADGLRR